MTTDTKSQEIAALNARIQELREMYFGKGHILGQSSWAADWGHVDDEIIRERKAIHDSARDQILQLQARVKQLTQPGPEKPTSATAVVGGLALCAAIPAAALLIFMNPWLAWLLLASGIGGQAIYGVCGKGANQGGAGK